jgi:large subunit ribosomal protein L30
VSTAKKLHVLQKHSVIGQAEGMRVTIRGLGLRGPGSEVTVDNTPSFRGAIKKVMHLVTVKEVDAATAPKEPASKKVP